VNQLEVGRFIRARREALQPEDVGLRRGSRRRSVGLRREELADLSDMSADYLARLERGAGPRPSEQMIDALARGLRLTVDERDHLLLLAGHRPPSRPGYGNHVSPGLMRILDSLSGTPAQVMGALGETLAQNATAVALFGDETAYTGLHRSAVYRWFTEPASRSLYPIEDQDRQSHVHVSLLREAVARLNTPAAEILIRQLRKQSAEFSQLWDIAEVGVRHSEEKRFQHPEVGELELFCQMVIEPDQLQTLLVFTATPGTESADRLRVLGVVGTYNMQGAEV
jgi:transcriptional regulator with XRE-family HTH domain